MAEKRPASAGLIALYIGLFILLVLALVLGVRVSNLNARVQFERSLTPTPVPAYPGNMMLVTPDPAAPTRAPILKSGSRGTAVTITGQSGDWYRRARPCGSWCRARRDADSLTLSHRQTVP